MDFNKTVDLIIRDLEEARDIIDDLKSFPGVPPIQVEHAKSKIRNAAEVISLFRDLPQPAGSEERKQEKEEKKKRSENRKPEKEEKIAEFVTKDTPESSIVADKFSNMPGINEKLGSMREDDNISDFLKSKPLTNLKEAIGINDRFLFIRELFNGDSNSYNQAITKIDEALNLSDAKALFANMAGTNTDSDAGRQLIDLLKRKFPADE